MTYIDNTITVDHDHDIELCSLDISKLLGGEHFIVTSRVASNGISVPLSKTLIDCGAQGSVFIHTDVATRVSKYLQTPLIPLTQHGAVTGYKGGSRDLITHAIRLHLMIGGRRFENVPMLIADIGRHELIIGKKWQVEHDVWLDVKNSKMIWPDQRPSLIEEAKQFNELQAPRTILKRPQLEVKHQEDADRRDQLMDQEIRQERQHTTCPRWHPDRTYHQDHRDSLHAMNRALAKSQELPVDPEPEWRKRLARNQSKRVIEIDIALISAQGFKRNLKAEGTEVFITSICEIDRAIEDKAEAARALELDDLKKQLLPQYHDYADVFSKQASDEISPHRPGTDCKIDLEDDVSKLGQTPLYKQSLEELEALRVYIMDNLSKGFIEPSNAPFASPILFVRKKGGGLRLCIDYRRLNALTKKDRYPLPLIDEMLERISRAKIFTKLDVRQAFHKIRMDKECEDLTTFKTRYGSYKYKVMPFGLTNGPAIFQRFMNGIFMDCLDKFLVAFIDDLLIYSSNKLEHEAHVKLVLDRLRKAGLQADIKKCEFHVTETKYLGFIIGTDGIRTDPDKVSAITQWSEPRTVRGVQSFLGFCNFYRRFIRDYSRIARPLVRLTKKEKQFRWDDSCQKAFDRLKALLSSTPVLVHYNPECLTRVETDASDGVVAGALLQSDDKGDWHPVAYFSKTMAPAEINYQIHDKELLAIVRSFEEWRAELIGLQRSDRFDVITDHKALEYFMTKRLLSSRQARWAELLSQYRFMIRYRPGKQNTLADTLSRQEADVEEQADLRTAWRTQTLLGPENVDAQIIDEMSRDPVIAAIDEDLHVIDQLLHANRTDKSLSKMRELAAAGTDPLWTLENGLLLQQGRLVVPKDGDLRGKLLDELHRQPSTAHPGARKTKELVKSRYYWKGMTADIDRYNRNCRVCRRGKEPRDKTPGLLKSLPVPVRPWQHIAMDFRSFPKDKHGYDAVWVVVDRLSKKTVSIPCYKTTTAKDMALMYIIHIYRWKGAPDSIVSDRGPQFISDFWDEFTKLLGIRLKLSTADHPQTDGQTEIINQHIATRLRPYVSYYQDNWSEFLAVLDFAAAILRQESTGLPPFQIDCGYLPRTSFDWSHPKEPESVRERMSREGAQEFVRQMEDVWKLAAENMATAQVSQQRQANKARREVDWDVGDYVYVSTKSWNTDRPNKKLSNPMDGPYKVIERVGNAYRLELPDAIKVHPIFSPDKLRRAHDDLLPGQTQDAPEELTVYGQSEYEVEEVLASRTHYRKLQYRVKWVGQDHDPTWYFADGFANAPVKLRDFHRQYPDKAGPPKRLDHWLDCYEKEISITPHEDDNVPEHDDLTKPHKKTQNIS